MDLIKALIEIVLLYTVFLFLPNAILAYLQRDTDKKIDEFCRGQRKHEEGRDTNG